jgi:hypothetical protein
MVKIGCARHPAAGLLTSRAQLKWSPIHSSTHVRERVQPDRPRHGHPRRERREARLDELLGLDAAVVVPAIMRHSSAGVGKAEGARQRRASVLLRDGVESVILRKKQRMLQPSPAAGHRLRQHDAGGVRGLEDALRPRRR